MQIDPEDPVVKLCAAGMQAEFAGKPDEARQLFTQAWETAQDDYEACIAAHYLARQQANPEEMLHWNEEALIRAETIDDERVYNFYPSLYLNMGYSHEMLGQPIEAKKYYELAAERINDLPAGPYRDMVSRGISEGRKRISSIEQTG